MAVYSDLYDYILTMIENELAPGSKLPGARKIAERFSCALPKVQAVLDSLEQSGVVESRERSGTYVREGYTENILPHNIACSKFQVALTDEQKQELRREFPEMHLSRTFKKGGVEIFSSFTILTRQQQYQDLSSIFTECFPDSQAEFYMEALKPFMIDGKLCAVPVIFSPQLLWYNPDIFNKAGAPLPSNNWGEAEFFNAIRTLHRTLAGRRIINYSPNFHSWIGFILASGGILFDKNMPDPVLADSLQTLGACLKYVNLLRELDLVEDYENNASKSFAEGKLAMFVGFRQSSYVFREYGINFTPQAVYMPNLGGRENHQGAALIAFRNEFHDKEKIKKLLKFWLSHSIQETLGKAGYGVPFRKSAALASLDPSSAPDKYLLQKFPPLSSNYHIHSEILGSVISGASTLLNAQRPENLPNFLHELATTMRFLHKITPQKKG